MHSFSQIKRAAWIQLWSKLIFETQRFKNTGKKKKCQLITQ